MHEREHPGDIPVSREPRAPTTALGPSLPFLGLLGLGLSRIPLPPPPLKVGCGEQNGELGHCKASPTQ